MIDYDAAVALLAERVAPLDSETVELTQARGRVLAQPVHARLSAPAGDVSAMDGIAVRDSDVTPGVSLRLVGASFAGQPFTGTLGAGEAVRISTGALLPAGADRVIVQEQVRFEKERVQVDDGYGPGWHVRRAGEDFREGDELLPIGTRMGAGQLLCAAAADQARLSVIRRPRVHILATGSELVAPGEAAGRAGAIPNSLTPALGAMIDDWGGQVVGADRMGDDLPALQRLASAALRDADVVVVTGGASVGPRDYAQAMFGGEPIEPVFSKVAMKPGKPVWVSRSGQRWIVGLPGNPSSALVTARLFLTPLLAVLGGRSLESAIDWRERLVAEDVRRGGDREIFLLARTTHDHGITLTRQDSGGQAQWASIDCLLRSAQCRQDEHGEWRVPCLML